MFNNPILKKYSKPALIALLALQFSFSLFLFLETRNTQKIATCDMSKIVNALVSDIANKNSAVIKPRKEELYDKVEKLEKLKGTLKRKQERNKKENNIKLEKKIDDLDESIREEVASMNEDIGKRINKEIFGRSPEIEVEIEAYRKSKGYDFIIHESIASCLSRGMLLGGLSKTCYKIIISGEDNKNDVTNDILDKLGLKEASMEKLNN